MSPLIKRATQLETFYRAYTMTWAELERIIEALPLACAKHCDPPTMTAIRQDFANILTRFHKGEDLSRDLQHEQRAIH